MIKKLWFSPAMLTLLLASTLAGTLVIIQGGDLLSLAHLGTRFSENDPNGSAGYDGQFAYYIAVEYHPYEVEARLDVPSYRYQRILYPILARLLAFGQAALIPWTLVTINLISLTGGVWIMQQLFSGWGINRWYALIYGLWAGFLLAVIVDLPEPLAYGLLVGAALAYERGKMALGGILMSLACFAKEVMLVFAVAWLIANLAQRDWKASAILCLALLPYFAFQGWLWVVFGQPGIGSGGDMATPFEWVPFMGLLRIGSYSTIYLVGMLVVFGPTIVWPAIWGAWQSIRNIKARDASQEVMALLLNSLVIMTLPFSTFRETGGLIRNASGLIVAILLFSGKRREVKLLNYCRLWMVLNLFLLKS